MFWAFLQYSSYPTPGANFFLISTSSLQTLLEEQHPTPPPISHSALHTSHPSPESHEMSHISDSQPLGQGLAHGYPHTTGPMDIKLQWAWQTENKREPRTGHTAEGEAEIQKAGIQGWAPWGQFQEEPQGRKQKATGLVTLYIPADMRAIRREQEFTSR